MTRIDDTFARLRAARKKAFVAYVMAGDPDGDTDPMVAPALASRFDVRVIVDRSFPGRLSR